MKIKKATIRNYGSLKDISFEGANFLVLIGPNSSGKSLIFEALMKFFNDFNPIGGVSAVTDMLWFKLDTTRPIEFEITLELDEQEVKELIPLGHEMISAVRMKFPDTFSQMKINRSLHSNGAWKTNEIVWSQIELITNDAVTSHENIQNFLQPLLQLVDYKMYFFTSGYSRDNIGGDRLLVNIELKKALTTNPVIDDLAKKGVVESSTEFQGKNWQEWAKENNLTVTSPTPSDLAQLGVITPEMLQQIITKLTNLRSVFKLVPAARDTKATPGQRSPLPDASVLQGITSTSVDTSSQAFTRWNKYREYAQRILRKQLEPNPTQVRIIDGDVGLFPAYIGGGDQSVLGLIWETMEASSIMAIEEPENHLHPRLQRGLLEYLREISAKTQVIICTHSPIFVSKLDINSVLLVSKDAEGATHVEPVNQLTVYRLIDELGIRASDVLDFNAVAFVEGKTDVKVFEGFKQTLLRGKEEYVGFIDSGGWTNMEYFANAKILRSIKPPRKVLVIFDGDTDKNEKIKTRILEELDLKDEDIITLKESSIETYLLVPPAIKRAFANLNLSEKEIRSTIDEGAAKKNKKELLDSILRRGGVGSFDDEKAGRIAKATLESEISDEIKDIFKKFSIEKTASN